MKGSGGAGTLRTHLHEGAFEATQLEIIRNEKVTSQSRNPREELAKHSVGIAGKGEESGNGKQRSLKGAWGERNV